MNAPRDNRMARWLDCRRGMTFGEEAGPACTTVAPCATVVAVRQITQRELRNQSGEIMRALEAGERFLVTRRGAPIGELIPLRQRQSARRATVVEIFRGAPRVDYRRLRRDLDAIADPDPKPRA